MYVTVNGAVRLWIGVMKMSDDLISREDTKQAIRHKFKTLVERCEINEVLNSMPSVQPKEKTGHWTIIGKVLIPLFRGGYEHEFQYKCSECGFEHALPIPKNFCPNCGAKMEA